MVPCLVHGDGNSILRYDSYGGRIIVKNGIIRKHDAEYWRKLHLEFEAPNCRQSASAYSRVEDVKRSHWQRDIAADIEKKENEDGN